LQGTSLRHASDLLIGECYRHINDFLAAWKRDQRDRLPLPLPAQPEPSAPDPADAAQAKMKQALESALNALAQGNEGKGTLEQFEVNGTQVDFKGRVRHRQYSGRILNQDIVPYDVTMSIAGTFDIAIPPSLKLKLCVDKPAILGGGQICTNIDLGNL
jgi:hypothetical protein